MNRPRRQKDERASPICLPPPSMRPAHAKKKHAANKRNAWNEEMVTAKVDLAPGKKKNRCSCTDFTGHQLKPVRALPNPFRRPVGFGTTHVHLRSRASALKFGSTWLSPVPEPVWVERTNLGGSSHAVSAPTQVRQEGPARYPEPSKRSPDLASIVWVVPCPFLPFESESESESE